jgi:hypothetical protein
MREPSDRGYIWSTLFLGDINAGTWPSRLGKSQELGQQNMVFSPGGSDPSSRQRGCYKITIPELSKENFKEKEKLVVGPRWVTDTKTD